MLNMLLQLARTTVVPSTCTVNSCPGKFYDYKAEMLCYLFYSNLVLLLVFLLLTLTGKIISSFSVTLCRFSSLLSGVGKGDSTNKLTENMASSTGRAAITTTAALLQKRSSTTTINGVGKLQPENTVLVLIDVQERFRSLIYNSETIINTCRYMTNVASILNIPILITEQYSKVFGSTISDCFNSKELYDINIANNTYEKKLFSICTDQVQERVQTLIEQDNKTNFLLMGIEAHVCVQQTCFDLIEKYSSNNDVSIHLICDGISSQQQYDRTIAIERMKQCGAYITTSQSATYMLMQSATHPNFKEISKLTVEHMKYKNEFNN